MNYGPSDYGIEFCEDRGYNSGNGWHKEITKEELEELEIDCLAFFYYQREDTADADFDRDILPDIRHCCVMVGMVDSSDDHG